MPKRIQRKRTRGWTMPPNTVYVGRPTKWGNPFRVGDPNLGGTIAFIPVNQVSLERVLDAYRDYMAKCSWMIEEHGHELRGKDLACWCKEGEPCHADILLELANQ